MAEQATLEILVKEGSGGSLLGRGPQPVPLSPTMPPSDWMQRLGESIKPSSSPLGRPGVQAPTPTEVVWKKGMEPPPVRGPGTIPQAPLGIFQSLSQQIFEPLKAGPKAAALDLQGGLLGLSRTLGPLGVAVGAVTLGLKAMGWFVDLNTKVIRNETQRRSAIFANDPYQRLIAEIENPLNRYVPGRYAIPFLGPKIQENEIAKIQADQKDRQNMRDTALRLAPFSGPLAGAKAQAQVLTLQGDIREAQALGPTFAKNLVLQTKFEQNMRALEAETKRRFVELDNFKLQNLAVMSEIALNTKDLRKRAEIQNAIDESMKGNSMDLLDLMRQMRDEIKKLREKQEKDQMEKPLSWFDDIVNGERGRPNFSGVPTDLVRETMRQQISPAF